MQTLLASLFNGVLYLFSLGGVKMLIMSQLRAS
jgi:hypothetical protein